MSSELAKKVDPTDVFSAFVLHGGDCARAAIIVGLTTTEVESMATQWGWRAKLASLTVGTKGPLDGNVTQRELRRGLAFIQAHRLGSIIDRLVLELGDDDALRQSTTKYDRQGNPVRDYKGIRDIAAAMRDAHELAYRALGDSMDVTRKEHSGSGREGDYVLSAMAAMDAADACPKTSSADLVRQALQPSNLPSTR